MSHSDFDSALEHLMAEFSAQSPGPRYASWKAPEVSSVAVSWLIVTGPLPFPYNIPPGIPPNIPPTIPPTTLPNSTTRRYSSDAAAHSSPPPVYQQNDNLTPLPGPSTCPLPESSSRPSPESSARPSPESSTRPQPPGRGEDHTSRRSSSCSSSRLDSAFSHYSINAEFLANLQAAEASYFPQQPPQVSSPPSPPTSSPSTESSLALSATSATSPSPELRSVQPTLNQPLPTTRRWVVFRGRFPGIYTSSTGATRQTDGFSNTFMLAFDSPAIAVNAYEAFRDSGTIPTHGHGPWVVFVGQQPGVFTSYEELCASVVGFSNNCYRSCESIEEGRQALDEFRAKQATMSPPAATPHLRPASPTPHRGPTPTDDSWWCCYASAEPGVYNGIARLTQASPALGGVRRVNSEEEGWQLWTTYLAAGKVCVISRTRTNSPSPS